MIKITKKKLLDIIYSSKNLKTINLSDINQLKDKSKYFVLRSNNTYRNHNELHRFALFSNFSYCNDKDILIINKLNFFINDMEINEKKIENFINFNGIISIGIQY